MHEENGLAEVVWRDISTSARAMLTTSELPLHLWHLAYQHACWLKNRMPNIENDNQIPFRLIFPNHKLNLSDVRIFGCRAYY